MWAALLKNPGILGGQIWKTINLSSKRIFWIFTKTCAFNSLILFTSQWCFRWSRGCNECPCNPRHLTYPHLLKRSFYRQTFLTSNISIFQTKKLYTSILYPILQKQFWPDVCGHGDTDIIDEKMCGHRFEKYGKNEKEECLRDPICNKWFHEKRFHVWD